MATRFRNVIVFGDSLSDIGLKVKTPMGKFAKGIRQMTTTPTGRFSDCRNWTDHMYEAATGGQSLIAGDASTTKIRSRRHQSLTPQSLVSLPPGPHQGPGTKPEARHFYYANYAMGGDCGGIPNGGMRFALGTFKDQVKNFNGDWQTMYGATGTTNKTHPDLLTLFLVWFGANDLYTAGSTMADMTALAVKVASKRRQDIVDIVGAANARFIFVNLPGPGASARYPRWLEKGKITQPEFNRLNHKSIAFNIKMEELTSQKQDGLVDVRSAVSGEGMAMMFSKLGISQVEHQPVGATAAHVSPTAYEALNQNAVWLAKRNLAVQKPEEQRTVMSHTPDKVHPTDPVYKYMWGKIREGIAAKQYTFGTL